MPVYNTSGQKAACQNPTNIVLEVMVMGTTIYHLVQTAVLLVFSATLAFAQTEKSQLNGTVTDSSGGRIVGARVTVTNANTGYKRSVSTDDAGRYVVPLLDPGTYEITLQKEGFRTVSRSGIKLDVALVTAIDFTLEVGTINETINVTSQAPLLDSGSATLGHLIENNSILMLPVNGRNSYSFAALVPGVRAPRGFTQVSQNIYFDQFISINGSRPNQNSFLLDGGVNSTSSFNGPSFFPSIDLVQEYKVQTNNFSAEFSDTTGGVVNVVTKSGTNQLHGSLYEFLRNDKLVATDFFVNLAGLKKGAFRWNQFGGTVGGPVWLPRIYDGRNRTFFFASYEGLRWTRSLGATGTMPTLLQRAGDFSQTRNQAGQLITVFDPLTTAADPARPGRSIRTAFPGNVVPSSRFDPVSRNLLDFMAPPNTPGNPVTGTNNFASNYPQVMTKNEFSARLDHSFTDNYKIFGRVSINKTDLTRPFLYGPDLKVVAPITGVDELDDTEQTVVSFTGLLRPSTVLELSSSFARYTLNRVAPGVDFDPVTVGLPAYMHQLQPALRSCFPGISVSGLGLPLIAPGVGGGFLGSCGFLHDGYDTFHEYGNLTHTRGSHTIKVGGDFGAKRLNTVRYTANNSYSFGPNFTQGPDPLVASNAAGVPFATFLLGVGSGNVTSSAPGLSHLYHYYGLFFQDDWKATSRLTLNLGVRYDYTAPWTERYNRQTSLDFNSPSPLQVPGLNLAGGLIFPGAGGLPRGQYNPDRNNIAPRFGFALRATRDTVVRGGFGLFYGPPTGGGYNGSAIPISGFQTSTAWVGSIDGITPANYLSDPFPNGFVFASGSSAGLATLLGQGITGMDRGRRNSYAEQWNLNMQRALPGNLVVDVAYAGSRGLDLYGDLQYNVLANEFLAQGSGLQRTVANPMYGKLPAGAALNTPTVQTGQLLRPYPQFSGVTAGNSSYGASTYHSAQLTVARRFTSGFSLQASYTFSKLLDDLPNATTTGFPGDNFSGGGYQDPNNRRKERAVASYDTPQSLTVNSVWDMPWGRGRRYWKNRGVLTAVLGNWQLNGILTLHSGVPLGLNTAANTLNNYGGAQRPNWTGKDPVRSGPIADRRSQYFDISAFSLPGPYTFGNTARLLSNLRGPGTANVDLSLCKNILIREPLTLQFRFETFNSFNRPEFGLPGTGIGSPTAGVISTQANTPRDIQFALKLLY